MSFEINYKGWMLYFDNPPSSKDLEEQYAARVTATEVRYPVATPTPLDREKGPRTRLPLEGRRVAFHTSGPGAVAREVFACLCRLGATVGVAAELHDEFQQVASGFEDAGGTFVIDWESEEPLHAVVVDAMSFERPEDLDTLRQVFRPSVMSLQASGRCLVVAGRPEDATTASRAATWYALDGFIRSLSGEMGPQGITANIVRVAPGAEGNLMGPLRFLLSPRAAYITAQTLRVEQTQAPGEDDFESPLRGKKAIVTGASGGMGSITAKLFAREGAEVVCMDLPGAKKLHKVAEAVNGRAVELDLTTPEAPQAFAEIARELGGVDIVAHLAGTLGDKMLVNMDAETWSRPVGVNLAAPVRVTERLIDEGLIRDGGRILCVSSVSGIAGGPTMTAYATSKSGVHGFVQYASKQLGERGVTVNAVAPGYTLTPFNVRMPQWMKDMFSRLNDLSQPGMPEDIANALLFLALPESRGINGHVLRVCGGSILGQ